MSHLRHTGHLHFTPWGSAAFSSPMVHLWPLLFLTLLCRVPCDQSPCFRVDRGCTCNAMFLSDAPALKTLVYQARTSVWLWTSLLLFPWICRHLLHSFCHCCWWPAYSSLASPLLGLPICLVHHWPLGNVSSICLTCPLGLNYSSHQNTWEMPTDDLHIPKWVSRFLDHAPAVIRTSLSSFESDVRGSIGDVWECDFWESIALERRGPGVEGRPACSLGCLGLNLILSLRDSNKDVHASKTTFSS